MPALRYLLADRPDLGGRKSERLFRFCELLDEATGRRLLRVVDHGLEPQAWLIDECAHALGIDPDYFVEWRLREAHRLFDARAVGVDAALASFDKWARSQLKR